MGVSTHTKTMMRTTFVILSIVALAAAVPVAKKATAKFDYFEMGRRSFSSGFTSSSGYSSGATPAPTQSPTLAGSTTITQVVTMGFAGLSSHVDFAGSNEQIQANFGYGSALMIVDSTQTGTSFKSGCRVTSVAAAARRADMGVTFTAVTTPALAAAAQSAAEGLTTAHLATSMSNVLQMLQASDAATFGSMQPPTVSAVGTPTVTTAASTSGASSVVTFSGVAFAVAAVAAFRR